MDAEAITQSVRRVVASGFPKKALRQGLASYAAIARGLLLPDRHRSEQENLSALDAKHPGLLELVRDLSLLGSKETQLILAGAYAEY